MSEEIKPLKIFVGYDSREDIAYEVCRQSILQTASVPVEIIPLRLDKLRSQNWYWREEDKLGSTEFTFPFVKKNITKTIKYFVIQFSSIFLKFFLYHLLVLVRHVYT